MTSRLSSRRVLVAAVLCGITLGGVAACGSHHSGTSKNGSGGSKPSSSSSSGHGSSWG